MADYDFVKAVREFHIAADQTAPSTRQTKMSEADATLRKRVICEELTEFCRELVAETREKHKIAKELADLIYVIAGTAVTMGETFMHNSVDHEAWINPEPEWALIAGCHAVAVLRTYTIVTNIRPTDYAKVTADCRKAINSLLTIAERLDIPIVDVFDEIHTNNMTKADPKTGKVTKDKYGKVLKPAGYKKPDIEGLLKRIEDNKDKMATVRAAKHTTTKKIRKPKPKPKKKTAST